jgi:PAS domain-containing protein
MAMSMNHEDINEQARLEELISYEILDTPPEKELNELVQIASAICDTPMAVIGLIDDKRQWYKASIGMAASEAERQHTFCRHTLNRANEVLVVEDPLNDDRFKNNPHVTGDPHIRFYAGAPLETPNGNVLGTLCVFDSKPKAFSESKKNALRLLAKRVMTYLDARKLILRQKESIELNANRLKQLTDEAPGAIYQFEMTREGKMSFSFISKGISDLHPNLDPEIIKKTPEAAFKIIHPEDLPGFLQSIRDSFEHLTLWHYEYRVVKDDGSIRWHMGTSRPHRREDGTVVWFGVFQDITSRVEYERTMEQIAFDISHVLRRPVSTLLGLASIIEGEGEMDSKKIKQYSAHIKTVSEELDRFTRKLNETYALKKKIITGRDDG